MASQSTGLSSVPVIQMRVEAVLIVEGSYAKKSRYNKGRCDRLGISREGGKGFRDAGLIHAAKNLPGLITTRAIVPGPGEATSIDHSTERHPFIHT
jgi:hypothetical protein